MKIRRILSALLSVYLFLNVGSIIASPPTGTLTVYVKGIKSESGAIRIALYNSQETYENRTNNPKLTYRAAALPIRYGAVTWKLENLPYGIYGIKLFHDKDSSGALKKNFIGRPTEGVGFSNNPKLQSHAPTFDEVKFKINKPEQTIIIQMINP